MNLNAKLPANVFAVFVRVLVAGAENGRSFTGKEMADRLEVAPSTAWKWLKHLSDCDLVYVKVWRRRGRNWVACYAWGFKEDSVPKPTPLSQRQHEHNYRQRKAKREQSPILAMVGHLT